MVNEERCKLKFLSALQATKANSYMMLYQH